MAKRLQGSYLAYSRSSGLLLQASVFMVVSRRPEEKSAATGYHSIGVGCCQQNRWPVKGTGLTAVPTQKLCCAISWSQLYLGKGKKLWYVGKGHEFTLSAPMNMYLSGWGCSDMTTPVRFTPS